MKRMKNRVKWAAGALVGVVAVVGGTTAAWPRERPNDEAVRSQVAAAAATLAEDDRFSGTVVVAKDGVPILTEGYGMANRETDVANDVDTLHNLASVGKMFTAIAIGQLVSRGKVSLDDSISEHLVDYPADTGDRVTIGHLLSHTSGIPDFFSPTDRARYLEVVDSADVHRDYLELFVNEPLAFEPGSRFEYSNSGFVVLGAIIEAVSGQSYYEYVEAEIFRPAGMNSTFWSLDEARTAHAAVRYTEITSTNELTPGQRRPVDVTRTGPLQLPEGRAGAHGGGWSTATDLLKFLVAVREHTLLDEPHTDLLFAGADGSGSADRVYGFWTRGAPWWRTLSTSDPQRAVGHSGQAQGVVDHVYMYPNGYDIVVLSNYETGADELMQTVDDLLLR